MIDYHTLLIPALFIFMDILTGVVQAIKNKTLSSTIMREGLYHKLGYVLTVALGGLCEWGIIFLDLGFTTPLVMPICVLICLTETLSIIENISRINPDLATIGIFDFFSKNRTHRADDEKENNA